MATPNPYDGCRIVNIRKGKKSERRDMHIYAELVDKDGNVLISADLPYILKALQERLEAPE